MGVIALRKCGNSEKFSPFRAGQDQTKNTPEVVFIHLSKREANNKSLE
jgi:hypothetical protein